MRFLLAPVGSGGDVHPFIGIGRELKARGHDVILFGAEPYRQVVEESGIGFVSNVSVESYNEAISNPDLWHPRKGLPTFLRMIVPTLESSRRALEDHYLPGKTMIVGHPLGFAARTFEEQQNVPSATIHLAPFSIRSVHKVPALPPGTDISGWPRWLKQALWYAVDKAGFDPAIVPELNRWRATLGLPPVRRVFKSWLNSPGMVIGLFPEWFGPRQPDWPEQFESALFPLWDDPAGSPIDPELSAFIDAGSPPVVVSPGSANRQAKPFFVAAAAALQRLGRRGIFLTGYPEQLPSPLPDTIVYRRYAPFSAVLPRSALLIHHGGIGTVAQAMASGVPHLIMPMAFDQPDNALRAASLGVARWLKPKRFTADNVTREMDDLLGSSTVAVKVKECRERLHGKSGIAMACDLLERRSNA
jgi:rhamnosyltransferase subunit B